MPADEMVRRAQALQKALRESLLRDLDPRHRHAIERSAAEVEAMLAGVPPRASAPRGGTP